MMHTYIDITIIDENALEAQKEMEAAFQIFRDYDAKYNFFYPESLLSKINASQHEEVEIPPELYKMLEYCVIVSEKSGGAFNINVGPLIRLWDFNAKNPRVPEPRKIKELLPLVNAPSFYLKDGILHRRPGMLMDLSGVVKGYAVDAASEYLIKRGISGALVNAGGNMRAIGRNLNGVPWKVGIVDPRSPEEIIGQIELENMSVATSGDYFNFFIKDGVRYHHIIDPHTGYPASKCMSATILSKSAGLADILAKPAFILGPDKAKQLLQEMGCEGIIIVDSRIETTRGTDKKMKLTSRKYELK